MAMAKEPVTPPTPQPAEPAKPPIEDPQPYTDPVTPPPADPQEDRPLRDPIPPGGDQPRMVRSTLAGVVRRSTRLSRADTSARQNAVHQITMILDRIDPKS